MLKPILVYTLFGYCVFIGIKIYVSTGDIKYASGIWMWLLIMLLALFICSLIYKKRIIEEDE